MWLFVHDILNASYNFCSPWWLKRNAHDKDAYIQQKISLHYIKFIQQLSFRLKT